MSHCEILGARSEEEMLEALNTRTAKTEAEQGPECRTREFANLVRTIVAAEPNAKFYHGDQTAEEMTGRENPTIYSVEWDPSSFRRSHQTSERSGSDSNSEETARQRSEAAMYYSRLKRGMTEDEEGADVEWRAQRRDRQGPDWTGKNGRQGEQPSNGTTDSDMGGL
jgi:hypothetical protein